METHSDVPQSEDDFANIIAQVRQGDERAVAELVRRYEHTVLRSVRSRLGKSMRRTLDSMDLVQSVHRSLIIGLKNERFQVTSSAQLIALAAVMVQRKVARHWRSLKRLPTTDLEDTPDDGAMPLAQIANAEPSPAETASASDLLEQFLSQLDDFDRRLVRLRLDGHSSVETATILGRDSAFIRMRWARLRQKLRKYGDIHQ